MSQDELCLYDHLRELLEHFENPSALAFFKSPEAREGKSKARTMVESGRNWSRELPEIDLARVLYASIALGGSTLNLYLGALEELDTKK